MIMIEYCGQAVKADNRGGLLVGMVQARWPAHLQQRGTEVFGLAHQLALLVLVKEKCISL